MLHCKELSRNKFIPKQFLDRKIKERDGKKIKMGKRVIIYILVVLGLLAFSMCDDFALISSAGGYGEEAKVQQGAGTVSGGDVSPDVMRKKKEILSLTVPEQMEVIINPWEMEGRTQVYSEEYSIKNCGKGDGQLVLSVSVRRAAGQDIEIRTDSREIHEGEEKKIYLEMNFGERDTAALAEGTYTYERLLGAGEDLKVWFSGAVNENGSPQWTGDEIEISIVYLWESLAGIKPEGEQN